LADSSAKGAVPALLGTYAVWYLVLAFVLPIPSIINGLLDDSFYYLQVARHVAAGHGSTFDGLERTNGYHPLWMWMLVPVHWLTGNNPEAALRFALGLSALLGFSCCVQIARLLRARSGEWAAAAGLLVFAWPRFLGQTVNLLETGLLLFLYLLIAGALLPRDPTRPDSPDPPHRSGSATPAAPLARSSLRRALIRGVLIGLACLARLDTIFLLAALTWHAATDRPRSWLPWISLSMAGVMVAPYLLWNLITFGHLQPVSGAVKSTFPSPSPHWHYLREFPEFTALLALGILFFLAGLRRTAGPWVRMLGVFGLAGALHYAYTLLFMTWGVDRWHFAVLIPLAVLGLPWLADRALRAALRPRPAARLRWLALGLGLVAAVAVQARSLDVRRDRHLTAVAEGARWAREHLEPGAIVAMTDAGVFAYLSGLTTVNLDGLINSYDYLESLRAGRVREYLDRKGVDYFMECATYGRPDLLDGTYETRLSRFWDRRAGRVTDQLVLYREDEVFRRNLLSRPFALSRPEPNAVILYRYRPQSSAAHPHPEDLHR